MNIIFKSCKYGYYFGILELNFRRTLKILNALEKVNRRKCTVLEVLNMCVN